MLNVLPSSPFDDRVDCMMGYSIDLPSGAVSKPMTTAECVLDLHDSSFREFGILVMRTKTHSTFLACVSNIVFRGAKKKMFRIYTKPIVACVTNAHRVRYRAIAQFKRVSMRRRAFLPSLYLSVPAAIRKPQPKPAFAPLLNASPKLFWSKLLVMVLALLRTKFPTLVIEAIGFSDKFTAALTTGSLDHTLAFHRKLPFGGIETGVSAPRLFLLCGV